MTMIAKQQVKTLIPQPVRTVLKSSLKRMTDKYKELQHLINRPNLYDFGTSERIGIIYNQHCLMSIDERMFLYAMIRGCRPQRVLEIGSRNGGSAAIMACALEDNNQGLIVGIDPFPEFKVSQRWLQGRFHLITKPSPQAISEAREVAGQPFDFVLIDGLHIYEQVKKDIEGTLPHVANGGYLLFHDAFHFGVSEALREALESYPSLSDCGYVCATPSLEQGIIAYGGFRMLRFATSPIVDPQKLIERSGHQSNKPVPQPNRDLLNHDIWYCRAVTPCSFCQKNLSKTEVK